MTVRRNELCEPLMERVALAVMTGCGIAEGVRMATGMGWSS